MEQTKNETKIENKTESKSESTAAPDNKGKPKKERKPLTEAQRLKRQKMIVLPAMVLVFIGAMWLIFAPSSGKEQEPGTGGYNIEMPDADKENRRIIGDKAKAYEQGAMEERQENRSRAMQQLGDLFDRETAAADGDSDFDLANPGGTEEAVKPTPKTIQSSAAAYRDLNATLGNFYEQPKNDNAEMDELLERIATLESELESGKERSSTMDEQVALMEKSYELAAKYMGGQNGTQAAAGQTAEPSPVQKAGKNTAKPVRQVTHQVVSSLGQPVSNAEFVASFSQERNRSFNTAVGVTTVSDRNTIPAYVYGTQSVIGGQQRFGGALGGGHGQRIVKVARHPLRDPAKLKAQRRALLVRAYEQFKQRQRIGEGAVGNGSLAAAVKHKRAVGRGCQRGGGVVRYADHPASVRQAFQQPLDLRPAFAGVLRQGGNGVAAHGAGFGQPPCLPYGRWGQRVQLAQAFHAPGNVLQNVVFHLLPQLHKAAGQGIQLVRGQHGASPHGAKVRASSALFSALVSAAIWAASSWL